MSGSSRHAFLGGNTPLGFFSYFDHLIRPGDGKRLFVIKGGPGSGKSYFMHRIGERLQAEGLDVEYFHCSSDADSLDAIRIPSLDVAWVDGTAPHVIDPKYPGVIDILVDFNAFCDNRLLQDKTVEIFGIQDEVSRAFQRAFRYLKAAKQVYDNIVEVNKAAMDHGRHNERTQSLIFSLLGNRTVSAVTGHQRKMFASAITPDGPIHFLPTLVRSIERRFIVIGEPGTGKSTLMKRVAHATIAQGFDIETYHSPLSPTTIDHVIVPDLNFALITSVEPHVYEDSTAQTINLNELRDYRTVKNNAPMFSDAWEMFWRLFELATKSLSHAKEVRNRLEDIYINAMDFAKLDALREQHINDTLSRL